MEVATDKSGGEGKGDVAVIVNPSDPAHNEALNSTQSAPAKRLMNRNRAKRPNASAALSSEPRAAAGGARKKGKAAVGKRKRIVESDDDDDDDYDATAAANNNEEEEKERAGKQEVTVKMGNVKLQFRGKVIQAKLPNEQQGVGLVSASAGSASEIQKDSSVANEPAPELQEIAGVGTSSRIIMPGDQKRPQQSPASSDTANKTQDLLANVPIQDNAAKPRSSLTNSAMKGKLAAKKDLTKRSATTSSNISASAVPASVTPTPITTSPVIPTSASVPAPVKKPKRPLPSSKVTSNPKPSTEVAAAPAPVISAEPSFLDSLFSGTIPQTEHEKQLQKEREEKAAKARTETLQSQLDEDKELSHKRVAILKSRAAVKQNILPVTGKPPPIFLQSSRASTPSRLGDSNLQQRLAGQDKARKEEIIKMRDEAKKQRAEMASIGGFDLLSQGLEMSQLESRLMRDWNSHQQLAYQGKLDGRMFPFYNGSQAKEADTEEGQLPKPLPHPWTFAAVFAFAGVKTED